MRESDAHRTSGLIAYVRNPETGESMMLSFPPGQKRLALEVQFISRTAPLRAWLEYGDNPEYDVRLRMDTEPPPPTGLAAAAAKLSDAAEGLRKTAEELKAPAPAVVETPDDRLTPSALDQEKPEEKAPAPAPKPEAPKVQGKRRG